MERKYLKRNTRLLKEIYNPFELKRKTIEIPYRDSSGNQRIYTQKYWVVIHKESKKTLAYGKFSELMPKMSAIGRTGSNALV